MGPDFGMDSFRDAPHKLAKLNFFKRLIDGRKARCLSTLADLSLCINQLKGLILAQNERWRRGLGMQVER